MHKRTILVMGVAFSVLASSSLGQTISVTTAPKVVELDGSDVYRARNVLSRFFRNERHPECYHVLFSQFSGNLRVDFVPKRPDPFIEEGQAPDTTTSRTCGRNVGYVLDERGRILRRVYSR